MTRVPRCSIPSALLAIAVLSVSAFSVAGCAGGSDAKTTPAPPESSSAAARPAQHDILDPQGNVVLYVSNQSLDLERVDIAIEVDGQPVLDQYFNVGSQHNFKQFILRLASGRHVLTAQSIKGKASLKKSFFVTGKRWVAVDYWYYTKEHGTPLPRQFDFRIQDQPMAFD